MDSFAPLLRPCLVMPSRRLLRGNQGRWQAGADQLVFIVGGRNQPDRRPGAIAGMRRRMRARFPEGAARMIAQPSQPLAPRAGQILA